MSEAAAQGAALSLGVRFDVSLAAARDTVEAALATAGATPRWTERRAPGTGDVVEALAAWPGDIDVRLAPVDDPSVVRCHPLFAGLMPVSLVATWPGGRASDRLAALERAWTPFSPAERQRIAELTVFPPSPARAEGALVVVRDHPLLEKLALLEQLAATAAEVWFVPKVDATKYRDPNPGHDRSFGSARHRGHGAGARRGRDPRLRTPGSGRHHRRWRVPHRGRPGRRRTGGPGHRGRDHHSGDAAAG